MKFTRIHTQVRVIDSDHQRLLIFESFDGSHWFLRSVDDDFCVDFEAPNYERARGKAALLYYNWLLMTGQEK